MLALCRRDSRHVVLHLFFPVLARFVQDPVRCELTFDLRTDGPVWKRWVWRGGGGAV